MSTTILAPLRDQRSRWSAWIPRVLAAVWIVLLMAGFGLLWRYKLTPGPLTDVPTAWLAETGLARVEGQPTLVLFVHPCCPCTRASVTMLRELLPRYDGRLTALVSSYRPVHTPLEWSETELLDSLADVPQARLVFDEDGREAARFGIRTSGHVLLYGPRGKLRFSGGISGSRGHLGENAGLSGLQSALDAALADEEAVTWIRSPIFGCPIFP
jgi:hypothetical protein